MNENKMTITVGAIIDKIDIELDRISQKWTTNTAKNRQKLEFVENLLLNIPENVVFNIEGVRGNGVIRQDYLPNMGSVVECIVKYFQTHNATQNVSKSELPFDTVFGWCKYEIKSSLSANSLATPSEAETTILVNLCGVFSIKKADVLSYVNKQGRLPHNKPCGKPIMWLMRKMGFDNIED